jgi:hypothetical protein
MDTCKRNDTRALRGLSLLIIPQLLFVLSLAPIPLLSYGPIFRNTTAAEPTQTETVTSAPQQESKQVGQTQSSCCGGFQDPKCTPWTIQVRGAAFLPLEHQIREIYGTASPTLEVESSYRLAGNLWQKGDQLLLWENIGWTTKTGRTIGFGYYTKLNLIPFSAGLEYEVHCGAGLDFYIGIGATYSLLRIKNYDGFETTHLNREAWGFTTKTGFRYTFCKHFFIDAFGDFYYTRFGEMNHDPIQPINHNFDAFFVGGAVGVKF